MAVWAWSWRKCSAHSARRVGRGSARAGSPGGGASGAASRERGRAAGRWGRGAPGGAAVPGGGGVAGVGARRWRVWPLCSTVTRRGGRSPYVTAHRTGTGLGWGGEAVRAPATGWAGAGRAEGGKGPVGDRPAAGQVALGFGGLLRQLRVDARLTQDELAEAAPGSQRGGSDPERGDNPTARQDTAGLPAGAAGPGGPAPRLVVPGA